MIPVENADIEFASFVQGCGLQLNEVGVVQLTRLVCEFYRTHPAEGVIPPMDDVSGDALLFQWGSYEGEIGSDGRPRELFLFDITRQFILADEDGDDAIWQYSSSLYFESTGDLKLLLPGEFWCWSTSQADFFEQAIRNSEAFKLCKLMDPIANEHYLSQV